MKRQAFLFSAGEYYPSAILPSKVTNLSSPQYDIRAMEKRFKQIGFSVVMKENACRQDYTSILNSHIGNSPKDSIYIVYYSGHGCHSDGCNYILPVDYWQLFEQNGSVSESAIDICGIIELFKDKGRLILILDACRSENQSLNEYFSEMTTGEDVYIAYATQFGDIANGRKEGLSYFTEALCEEILTPNIDVDSMFVSVRQKLLSKHGKQISTSVNCLVNKVILNPHYLYEDMDKRVYDFIERYGEQYNEEYGVWAGEYYVFIDAAQFFDIPLLDVYWMYTKVQVNLALSKGIKMPMLTEAEQKLIDLHHLEMGGFKQDNTHTWSYRNRKVRMGEIPICPPSLLVSPPENEFVVEIMIDAVVDTSGYVICEGESNLPEGTKVLISLESNDIAYRASSKATVDENGNFRSERFSYHKASLPKGTYEINLTVPIAAVQPEHVKKIFGDKGRNLVGDFVETKFVMGNVVKCSKKIIVS